MARPASLAVLAITVACGSPTKMAEPAPATTAPVVDVREARVRIELPGGAAPWLDTSAPGADDALAGETVREYGAHAALIKTSTGGWFVIDDRRGAIGPIAAPSGALWIGLGAGDRVLAALPGGALVAASADDAVKGAFRQLGEVPGALIWDAAGDVIAAGTSWDEIKVSTDGGHTFRKGSVGSDRQISEVWARTDGVVVALAHPVGGGDEIAYVSRAGARFTRSRYQPGSFDQIGSWIGSGGAVCSTVLSRDGAHWVRANLSALADRDRWAGVLARTGEATGFAASGRITSADPPPPPAPSRRGDDVVGRSGCPQTLVLEPVPDDRGRLDAALDAAPEPAIRVACRGLDCLRQNPGAAPLDTSTALSLLSDGTCSPDDGDPDDGRCRRGAPFTSLPHAIRRSSPQLLSLPADCAPVRVLSARGLGILVCGGERTTIHTIDDSLRWRREAELDVPAAALSRLTMADDGAILVTVPCSASPCRAFARRPVAAGATDAWREVSVPGALTYRAVAGGSALALASAGGSISFVLDSPAAGARTLATLSTPPPNIHEVTITARGFVAITVREGRHLILYQLGKSGSLLQ